LVKSTSNIAKLHREMRPVAKMVFINHFDQICVL
jgi:hypothetical protein